MRKRYCVLKRALCFILSALLLAGLTTSVEPGRVQAASKPGKTAISSVELNKSGLPVIKWKKVDGATGYRVFRKTETDTKWVKVTTTAKTSFTDKKVKTKAGSAVQYKIRTYVKDSGGKVTWGAYSKVKSVTMPGAPAGTSKGDYSSLDAALKLASDRGLIGLKKEDGKQYIAFGSYDMGWLEYPAFNIVRGDGKKETLLWEVLDYSADSQQALVLCKNIISYQRYHDDWIDITWEDCTLRKWLNEDFYKSAFSSSERDMIVKKTISNPDNVKWDTEGGNDTEDRIFPLSFEETDKYFTTDKNNESEERVRKTCIGEAGHWWLRSPGNVSDSAAYVADVGYVSDFGNDVDYVYVGVCPAFWINLNP